MRRVYNGKVLAKILIYYGILQDVSQSEFNIVCPFHDDINPSMRINLQEGSYFCFGCRKTGNAFDFVKEVNKELTDLQCAILIEKILRSEEVKKIQIKVKKRKKKNSKKAILESEDYYFGLLKTDWRDSLDEDEEKVLRYMKKRGFNRRALQIAQCRVNIDKYYPIIFPILDNGEFKGWVCRTTDKYVEKKRKYLYNDGFYKRNTLCGNYEENSLIFICEGFMDYLSLRTRGKVKNVVALLGWHMSDEQCDKLKQKGITTVVSALDNDECGKKGTEYLKKFFNVIQFEYPQNCKDTADMTVEQIQKEVKRCKNEYIKIRNKSRYDTHKQVYKYRNKNCRTN